MFAFINRNRSDLCKALAASLTVPLTFCCSAFVVYFGNKHDFFLQATDFLTPFFFVTVVVSSVLFLVQLPFVGRKYFNGVNIAVFTLAFFMWCQGNLFNLGYGSVFLNEIFFGIFHWANWEHFLYFFLVVLIVVYRRAISKYMLSLSALLVFTQLTALCGMVGNEYYSREAAKNRGDSEISYRPSWRRYEYTYDGFFEFSRNRNVIVFVLDSQGFHAFERILEKEPELRESLRDFISFSNASSDARFTLTGIMQILTGCEIPEAIRVPYRDMSVYGRLQEKVYTHDGALIKTLAETEGFRCDVIPCGAEPIYWDSRWISNIRLCRTKSNVGFRADLHSLFSWTCFRIAPSLVKESESSMFDVDAWIHYFDTPDPPSPRPEVFLQMFPMAQEPPELKFKYAMEHWPWSKTLEQGGFKFVHFNGPHPPFLLNEHGEYEKHASLTSEVRQGIGALRLFVDFLKRLKQIDAYDNSLIVLTADHGSFPLSVDGIIDNSRLMQPILLIKRQNTHRDRMKYSDLPVNIRDIAPTVFSELGLPIKPDRVSVFAMPEETVEKRNAVWKQLRNKYDRLYFHPKFQKQTGKKQHERNTMKLQQFDVSLQDRAVRLEFFGDSTDSIGRDHATFCLVLDSISDDNAGYLSDQIEPLRPGKSWQDQYEFLFGDWKTNFWGAVIEASTEQIDDGDYRLGVLVSRTEGNYCSLNYVLKVRGGIPAELVPTPTPAF